MTDESTQLEMSGPDVEEAVARGLAELGLSRSEVSLEVLDEGSRGLLGLNARPARVRLTRSEASAAPVQDEALEEEAGGADDGLEVARETLMELLDKMRITARVEASWGEPDEPGDPAPMLLDIRGDDLGGLIGRKGETLAALQYITRLIASRELGEGIDLQVDVEGYKARRAQQLTQLAHRTAEQVMKHGRALPLEPMPANERRIIHIALRDHEHVFTESQGVGPARKVTIYPKESG